MEILAQRIENPTKNQNFPKIEILVQQLFFGNRNF